MLPRTTPCLCHSYPPPPRYVPTPIFPYSPFLPHSRPFPPFPPSPPPRPLSLPSFPFLPSLPSFPCPSAQQRNIAETVGKEAYEILMKRGMTKVRLSLLPLSHPLNSLPLSKPALFQRLSLSHAHFYLYHPHSFLYPYHPHSLSCPCHPHSLSCPCHTPLTEQRLRHHVAHELGVQRNHLLGTLVLLVQCFLVIENLERSKEIEDRSRSV